MESKGKSLVKIVKETGLILLRKVNFFYSPSNNTQPYVPEPRPSGELSDETPRLPMSLYDVQEYYRREQEPVR